MSNELIMSDVEEQTLRIATALQATPEFAQFDLVFLMTLLSVLLPSLFKCWNPFGDGTPEQLQDLVASEYNRKKDRFSRDILHKTATHIRGKAKLEKKPIDRQQSLVLADKTLRDIKDTPQALTGVFNSYLVICERVPVMHFE